MHKAPFLTAQEAATELGIKLPTLYAYVSRGLVRSEAGELDPRERRYFAEDVYRLKEQQEQRRDPTRAIAGSLHWGAPVLESALTLIRDGKLYYRGYDAVMLASQHTVEEVAGLLWEGNLYAQSSNLNKSPIKSDRIQLEDVLSRIRSYPLLEAFQMALLMTASHDPTAYDLRPSAVRQTAGKIMRLMTTVATNRIPEDGIAETLAQHWMPRQQSSGTHLFSTILILLADHEFNVSSFTARCVASAGATPYEVVIAGLAALQGVKHGGAVSRVEALLEEIHKPANTRHVLSRRLKRGDNIPGFGHKLYPEGDPRARVLLGLISDTMPHSSALSLAKVVMREAKTLLGEEPNSDFALAVLTRLLNLPEGYGQGIFALGRTIGWLAHAMEQYQSDRLIRPRARYIGNFPQAD